ncbi:MAG TPA: DUF5818 domain-containing protein [Terriglobales bacterium]|jgi:hypothetical protein|nr:DUF5818 domain-containing protein [Terriglobales bacterium]
MRKNLMLAMVLLTSAIWLQAQQGYPQSGGTQSSDQSMSQSSGQSMSKSMTVRGCLQGTNGSYTLTDEKGMTYQLSGDTSKLAEHVGHEVQITGTTSGASQNGSSMGSQQQMLEVKHMKHISTSCTKSSMGK